jgi:hypothetical protein
MNAAVELEQRLHPELLHERDTRRFTARDYLKGSLNIERPRAVTARPPTVIRCNPITQTAESQSTTDGIVPTLSQLRELLQGPSIRPSALMTSDNLCMRVVLFCFIGR